MSKNKPRPGEKGNIAPVPGPKAAVNAPGVAGFSVPYPMLWLALAAFAVYFPTFHFGLTELDDSIFINEFRGYNEDLHNLVVSFQRGLFDAVKDPYYRPLFMDSMLLNYQWADHGQNIGSYHIVNVLFHLASVLLLFKLFRKLNVKELHAFILSLLFAVLPVLSQAVAWIPGRNDTLLAIFTFSFLIFSIDYAENGKTRSLLLSGILLLLAFFTKETAVFAAPAAFTLIILVSGKKWNDKNNLIQYGIWTGCFLLWYVLRAQATSGNNGIAPLQAISDFIYRLPVVIQYIGKIFLPFNLSVFPTQQDTVYYYGIIAIAGLAAALFFAKEKNMRTVLAGFIVFLLFLLPALIVPQQLNQQTFEHRLYLPVIGLLLILPQTILFKNKLRDKQLLIGGAVICILFAALNFAHQDNFKDPVSFWSQAAKSSPNSAYADMMLAARETDVEESYTLFHKAYRLNPKEKYLNYYYGVMLQKKDSVLASEPYLLAEKSGSNYYECDFYLARVAMEKKDFNGAIGYLQSFLKKAPNNPMANNNLLLLYMQMEQRDNARNQVKHMQAMGLEVPATILQQLSIK